MISLCQIIHNSKNTDLIKISKRLSWLLRHGAHKSGVLMTTDGYVYIDEILALESFKNVKLDQIKEIVDTNEKKRFVLNKDCEGKLKIKACQGHSIEVPDLELTPITKSSDVPVVLHGTTKQAWQSIKDEVGYRGSSNVLISIDLDKALKDGLQFFRTPNNVILSPGNEKGYISPSYFKFVNFI
ncbi:hypothetical protein HELRODRAFT_161701 [Helobdella robusta]|uniref:2'-phosphotransferase n=1 Tax=Helobdella robusta TaxID=6412 RepID=T1ERS8_HELRO|nr:hypothetical protein HELRODRAFT_161701 [Helobdella robusta]ESO02430.1 hypothetical protein HELRODRAFT_161701 [Helobdella robusta]